jgi:poly(3-hydroxybutyrate) depolymerase
MEPELRKSQSGSYLETTLPEKRGHDFGSKEMELDYAQELLRISTVKSQFGVTQVVQLENSTATAIHCQGSSSCSIASSKDNDHNDKSCCAGRFYTRHVPARLPAYDETAEGVALLVFLHGSRGCGQHEALQKTRWIERANGDDEKQRRPFIVIFGQAKPGLKESKATCDSPMLPSVPSSSTVSSHTNATLASSSIHFRSNPADSSPFAPLPPYLCPVWGHVAHGELYWEIRDAFATFHDDLHYLCAIVSDVHDQLIAERVARIDLRRVYLMGHSNGGVFSLLALLYLPGLFRAVCSHMGGIGWDPYFYLPFEIFSQEESEEIEDFGMRKRYTAPKTDTIGCGFANGRTFKSPLLLVTGDRDVHRQPCQAARDIFETEGWHVDYHEQVDTQHHYNHSVEELVWDWFLKMTGELG